MNEQDLAHSPTPPAVAPPASAALATFMTALEQALAAALAGTAALEQAARPLVLARQAKRARALVAWLVGQATAAPEAAVLDVAVAIELVHAASLLHDDVVDGATERRGLPSANARFGATIAVLSGDLLLTSALARLRPLGAPATERAVDVVAEMTRAVAAEFAARRRIDLPLPEWRAMAEGKTGALFGLAACLVAGAAGDPERAGRFDRALRHLGVAFQIADDAGDLVAGGGETPYQDLRDGNPSFPILVAARRSAALAAALEAAWSVGEPDAATLAGLAERVARSGALDVAAHQVHDEIAAARALLRPELAAHSPEVTAIVSWAEALASAAQARYPRAPDAARGAVARPRTAALAAAEPGGHA